MLTRDLVQKRDVLRRQLGDELGDRTFREWLEASVAAAADTDAPMETPVPEPQAAPVAPVESPAPEAATSFAPSSEERKSVVPEAPVRPGRGCKWIEAERGDPGWPDRTCGRERAPGRPYCREHCRKAYRRIDGTAFPLKHFDRPPPARRRRALAPA